MSRKADKGKRKLVEADHDEEEADVPELSRGRKHISGSRQKVGRKRGEPDPAADSEGDEEDAEEEQEGDAGEDDSPENLTQQYTQAASQALSQFTSSITEEERDKVVSEVVRYMLMKSGTHMGVPVTREELTGVVNKVYKDRRGLAGHAIVLAQAKFAEIFGYEMKEFKRGPRKKGKRGYSEAEGATARVYVLRNLLPEDLVDKYVSTDYLRSLNGFTMLVLSLILFANERITEDALWQHLKKTGISREQEDHPVFGSADQLMQTLIKQRYIQREKEVTPEGDVIWYTWAEMAYELGEQKVWDFTATLQTREANGNN